MYRCNGQNILEYAQLNLIKRNAVCFKINLSYIGLKTKQSIPASGFNTEAMSAGRLLLAQTLPQKEQKKSSTISTEGGRTEIVAYYKFVFFNHAIQYKMQTIF